MEDLQRRLNEFGARPALVVDGIFGRKTEAAVVAFQREYGLSPDGVVGKKTWNVLDTGTPPRTPTAPSGETEAARPCGVGDALVLAASWSLATARLQLVVPALENAVATGVFPDDLKAKLETHFRIPVGDTATQQQRVQELIAGYRQIAATLASMPATRGSFSCGGAECAPGDYAYVRIGSPVRIFMCDIQRDWHNLLSDPLDLAATWVHELSHELLTSSDHGGGGYYNHRARCPVGMAPARNNADSWANFAVEYP